VTRLVVLMDNGTELSIDGSSLSPEALATEVSNSLSAPGGVMTLHARNRTHVIPVRAIRHAYVEPEEPS
jgi:hypothetical protein